MKSRFTGFTDVFKFAFVQSVKTKAFLISIIVLCGIALVSMPLITAITSEEEETVDESKADIIGTVYIEDNAFDGKLAEVIVDNLKKSESYAAKTYTIVDDSKHEEIFKTVKESKAGDVLLQIDYIDNTEDIDYGFDYVVYYGEEVDDLDTASNNFSSYVDSIHEKSLADMFIDNEAGAKLVSYDYSVEVFAVDSKGEIVVDESALDMTEYWVTYTFIIIGIFAISLVGGKVAEQIVTEKSSKVIEYIMTSIRPMALITGKVIASIAVILTMLGSMFVCLVISVFVNSMIFSPDGSVMLPEAMVTFMESDALAGASAFTVILSLIIYLLGFVLYGFIAGIAGATVSKVEEMAEGVKLFTFAMIIGAYVVLAYVMSASMGAGDWGVFTNVVYCFPLTAMFIVPAYLILGKVSVAIALVSVAITIACIVLLMIFVSGIYEYLIYYNGSPLKIKDLIGIFRSKRRAK